ncbi:MAG: mechanosensitive ion channel, partial [Rickettsiales bacterium]|nr:mechanosensitive ion channel [Rickettsiales bacterium]
MPTPSPVPNFLELDASPSANPLSRVTENFKISEPSVGLGKKLAQYQNDLIAAFTNTEFYVQVLMVASALALAWVMSMLIRKRLDKYFEENPPKHYALELLKRCLCLTGPLLALLYVGVLKPFSDDFSNGYSIAGAALHITFAWLLAKIVWMTVQTKPVANLIASLILISAVLKVTAFTQVTVGYLNSVAVDVGSFHISLLNFINGFIILIIVFWIAGLMSRSLEKFLRRTSSLSYTARELTVKFFRILFYFLAMLITLSALGVDLTAFAVFGGALGVGIGLGLQKITANFVSGITLLLEKSIKIGDLIEVANITGNVRELN